MADVAEVVENMKGTLAEKASASSAESWMACVCLAAMATISIIIGSARSRFIKDEDVYLINGWKSALKHLIIVIVLGYVLYFSPISWKKEKEPSDKLTLFGILRSNLNLIKILDIYIRYLCIVELLHSMEPYVTHYKAVLLAVGTGGLHYLLSSLFWVPNNLLVSTLSARYLASIHVDSARTGCVLIGGLMFWNIFLTFGTDATILNIPLLQLIFPYDILRNGIVADGFVRLAVGCVCAPGIFIAFLQRFDTHRSQKPWYFSSSIFGYVAGVLITFTMARVFDHGQPMLLYVVPLTVGVPLLVAYVKGELAALFAYQELVAVA